MPLSAAECYPAYCARDARFDGLFFVGIVSTGIYCRPICPARTARAAHCRFFPQAAAAQAAGFRPCLRCRPELAPGSAPVDDAQRVVHQVLARLDEAGDDAPLTLAALADAVELSPRTLRRMVQAQLGVPLAQWRQHRRLSLSRQLLMETSLPITEVAFAAGFASLRRFHDAFKRHFAMPPTALRRRLRRADLGGQAQGITVQLAYRPPLCWQHILEYLRGRTLSRAEWVTDTTYRRVVGLGALRGWVALRADPARAVAQVRFAPALLPGLPTLLRRLRNIFDLDARSDVIDGHLARSPLLAPLLRNMPGLRVPGAWNGFELATRAILGQQISVKAATTLAGRLMAELGEPCTTPWPQLTHLSPSCEQLATCPPERLMRLGIVRARAHSLIALARAVHSRALQLQPGAEPQAVVQQLQALPGIGPWTAHYIALRALRWPDAFPKEDLALRQRLGGVSARQAEVLAQPWRPWRGYALMHLWQLPAGTVADAAR